MQPPPLWLRWVLAVVVAVAVIVSIVIAIHRAGPEGPASEAGAEAETGRVADLAITEDEAPRSGKLAAGSEPTPALEAAIGKDVEGRIGAGQLTGPLQGVRCRPSGAPSKGRDPYRCTVRSAGIEYPFLAVVDASVGRLTWCKVDQSAVADAGPEIPISPSCRA
jgi:hypothetical protein